MNDKKELDALDYYTEDLHNREYQYFYGNAGKVELDHGDTTAAFILANPKESGKLVIPHQFVFHNFSKVPMSAAFYYYARPAGKLTRSRSILPVEIHKEREQLENARLYQGKNIQLLSGDCIREFLLPAYTTRKEETEGSIRFDEGTFVVILIKCLVKMEKSISVGLEAGWFEVNKQ